MINTRFKTYKLYNILIIMSICSLFSYGSGNGNHNNNPVAIRPAAVAGSFYPSDKDSITKMLSSYFKEAAVKTPSNDIAAVIVPHAGYVFSGSVAASAFAQIDCNRKYEHIFLIGPSHHVYMDSASINNMYDYYATPLGNVAVDTHLCSQLIKDNTCFKCNPDAHSSEHCLEVQLPFIQYHFKYVPPIVPIIVATQSLPVIRQVAEALKPYFNEKNLFVISSDFSHYPCYDDANEIDGLTGKSIETGDVDKFIHCISSNAKKKIPNLATSACGQSAIAALLYMIQGDKNITIHHIQYRNSGDSEYGGRNEVVGYHSFMMTRKAETAFSLTDEEKAALIKTARQSIARRLGKYYADNDKIELTEKLKACCGAFVTLNEGGQLRGCIGHFGSDIPLYKVVDEMAEAAAFEDPRFYPLQPVEFDRLEIEISVLSPMKKISSIDEFEYGEQGIYISKGGRSGTFLPQVAQETNWSKEEFLGHCARDKAGLSWDGWKDADLYTYEAVIFKEKK